eukprot:gene13385-19233_t
MARLQLAWLRKRAYFNGDRLKYVDPHRNQGANHGELAITPRLRNRVLAIHVASMAGGNCLAVGCIRECRGKCQAVTGIDVLMRLRNHSSGALILLLLLASLSIQRAVTSSATRLHLTEQQITIASHAQQLADSLGQQSIEGRLQAKFGRHLQQGFVPAQLALQAVAMPFLNLRGSLPNAWSKLTGLTRLDLSNNLVDGTLPSTYRTLKALEELDLSYNSLSGTIPSELYLALSSIKQLDFRKNAKLCGTLPISWLLAGIPVYTEGSGLGDLCPLRPPPTPASSQTPLLPPPSRDLPLAPTNTLLFTGP